MNNSEGLINSRLLSQDSMVGHCPLEQGHQGVAKLGPALALLSKKDGVPHKYTIIFAYLDLPSII